jgi:ribosomal protein S27E
LPEEKKKEYNLRCMRCLGGRITVQPGQTEARCPHCGQGWRITWVTPDVAKIRGRLMEGRKT